MQSILIHFGEANLEAQKNSEGQFNLTILWKLSGGDENKRPAHWIQQNETQGFIKATAKIFKCTPESLLKSKRGKHGGGTWAHEQIFLEYMQYLDPRAAVLVNQNFIDRVEEEKNPDKILDRYEATYKRKGKTGEWINARMQGRSTRNEFTGVLAAHGVEREGYRNCTNAVYDGLFGGSTSVVREKMGLTRHDHIRDNMNTVQLAATQLVEALAKERIEKENLRGNGQCEIACKQVSKAVGTAIIQSRRA